MLTLTSFTAGRKTLNVSRMLSDTNGTAVYFWLNWRKLITGARREFL